MWFFEQLNSRSKYTAQLSLEETSHSLPVYVWNMHWEIANVIMQSAILNTSA